MEIRNADQLILLGVVIILLFVSIPTIILVLQNKSRVLTRWLSPNRLWDKSKLSHKRKLGWKLLSITGSENFLGSNSFSIRNENQQEIGTLTYADQVRATLDLEGKRFEKYSQSDNGFATAFKGIEGGLSTSSIVIKSNDQVVTEVFPRRDGGKSEFQIKCANDIVDVKETTGKGGTTIRTVSLNSCDLAEIHTAQSLGQEIFLVFSPDLCQAYLASVLIISLLR